MTSGVKIGYRICFDFELKARLGPQWRDKVRYKWLSPQMDYLHGRVLTDAEYKDVVADRRGVDTWNISEDMLIKNQNQNGIP